MEQARSYHWSGTGKWLSFATAFILLVTAIPMVFTPAQGAAAGWNIFLGLLLFGTIASRAKAAPTLAFTIAVLLGIRLFFGLLLGGSVLDLITTGIMLGLMATSGYDLRQQAKRF